MKASPQQSKNSPARSTPEAADSRRENPAAGIGRTAAAQQKIVDGINNSPRMTLQRRRIEGYLGMAPTAAPAPVEAPSQQPVQRLEKPDDDAALQSKSASAAPAQLEHQPKPNNTGLPDNLKSGIEALSGLSMDNVKVHYNSSQPAQLNALAYAQGADIHVAPGQEKHLPHEAWHVVQQAQGRVKSTMQMRDGMPVNDDKGLEHEADVMGERAVQMIDGGQKAEPDLSYMLLQQAPVAQMRAVATIKVDIDTLKAAVNAFGNLPPRDTAANILARETELNPHRVSRDLLHAEIVEKANAHGRPVGTEAAINTRLAQIPGELATATADVVAGSQEGPPKAIGWSAAAAAYRTWEAKKNKLAENQQKIIDLNAESASKTADIPIAQLVDARNVVDAKLAALDANLLKVKRERYEYDLITTQAPACTTFKDEGTWGSGPSTLGVFVFPLPDKLNGIACCIDKVEVHAHYQGGTKKIRKAHFRSGPSNGDNIYNGEPATPAEIGGWQGTLMALCNGSIP